MVRITSVRRAAALLLVGAAVAGCGRSPTGVVEPPEPAPSNPAPGDRMAPAAHIAAFLPVLDYARDHLVPSLSDRAEAARLDAELASTRAALEKRDASGAGLALERCERLVSGYGDADSRVADGANLGVVGLMLARAQGLLVWDGR